MPSNRPGIVELLWDERPSPRRGPKPTLSPAAVARAGIEIADAEGLAAVTMQRVADAVGVTKMAIYRYVPGKDELVAVMVDVAIAGPPDLADVPGWRPKLDAWARQMFDLFLRHPWAMDVTVGARVMGPNEVAWTNEAVAALTDTGLDGGEMLDTAVLLVGHVRNLAQQTAAMITDTPEHTLDATIASLLRGREHRYPALAAALSSAAKAGSQDQALDFGLSRILDGVAHLIESRA